MSLNRMQIYVKLFATKWFANNLNLKISDSIYYFSSQSVSLLGPRNAYEMKYFNIPMIYEMTFLIDSPKPKGNPKNTRN